MKSILRRYIVIGVSVFCWIQPVVAEEVANVNGKAISNADLAQSLSAFNETQKNKILQDKRARQELIENLIEQELLIQEAEKSGIDKSNEFKQAYLVFRRNFLANAVLEKKIGPLVTNGAAKKYYADHKNLFSTTQVHSQHILLDSETQAKSVLEMAKRNGADFQVLAEKYSRDPAAKNNRGDLGYLGRDGMPPEYSDVVFKEKPGQIIGPVRTAFGYHVIKIIDKKVGRSLGYDEVELRVKTALKQDLLRSYLNKVKYSAKIKRSPVR